MAPGHYRHIAFTDGLVDYIREAPHVRTLYDLFQNSVSRYADLDFLGHRPYNAATKSYGGYTWQTYGQVNQRVNAFGSGIMHLNDIILGGPQLNRWSLGIWSHARPEWFITEMSCNFFNLVSVALYETLGPDAVEYVINHAEIPIVVASANHIASLLENTDKLPGLKAIVSMDSLQTMSTAPGATNTYDILRAWAAEKGIVVYDFLEIESLGSKFPRKHSPPKEDEVASLCYTSGTTGQPKGAMLTHKNFIAAVSTNVESMTLTPKDTMISFLPLAHIMGRYIDTIVTYSGAKLGYFHGDILLLLEDIAELKPTFFPAVPRLLNRIYAKLVAATIEAPGLVGVLARRGVAAKLANLAAGKGVHHPLWDRLLFNKVKMALGGQVQVIVTGSAPIAKEVLNFLRIAFGCVVLEGYGATESMGTAMITMAEEHLPGHVGGPRSGCEVKLVDVPDMNYLSTDQPFPRGEICLRGAHIIGGYYKDEKNTKEAIDTEGWLHTGDIGFVDTRGCFTIIDRKKNIFKLAQGEYVAPEKIENLLTARCKLIMQIFVYGDSLESSLVAISVPEPETFLPFAHSITGIKVALGDEGGLAKLCQDSRVQKAYLQELDLAGKAGGLRGFEFVKRVHLTTDMFSVENGLLTPTFKVDNPVPRILDKTPLTQFSYDCQSNYEHRKITVALKHPKPGTIQAGRYTGTLNFPIDPLKMPSSTILEKGRVMYKIVARLRRKFSNGDLVAEQDVWVFNSSLQRPSATDAAQEKMVYSPETSMPLSLVPTLDEPFILHPKISTSCEIPKAVFCAGETFPLAIKLVAVPVDPSHQPSSVSQPAKPGLLLPNWIKSRIGGTNGSENVALAMALPTVVVRLQQTVVYKDHAGTAMFHEHSNHAARFQLQGRIGAASAALLVVLPSLGDVLVLDSSRAENGAQRTKTGTANNCKIQATAYGFKPSAECKALTIRHELQVYLEYSIRGSSHPKLSRYSGKFLRDLKLY
ncbi:hypothetical protein BGX28_010137 [Mortierella sp. GBA30]|nr:hypothetical protein BGX28_010137 [Mortierella sp. GBA30]